MAKEASDSVDAARLIDAVCDEFEQLLAAGQLPQIEVMLDRVAPIHRLTLLMELLGLEVEFRVARAEQPTANDYAQRFPELSVENIAAIFEAPHAGPVNTPTVIGDSAATSALPANRVLRYFGDYELLRELARGGMGVVYQARQKNLNRIVAVKLILAGQFAHEEEIQRFQREAESAAQLDHPHIVPVFETGAVDGQYFLSMGFVQGQSLAQRIAQGPLEPREAAALLKILADAIAYAHGKKIIHRDLKPGNVLLDMDGVPRITDFGLAKTLEGGSDLTSTGQVMGTPSYMPPEQALGQTHFIGPRSDVYSLGAILYCLLTGKPPFQADSVVDTLKQVVDREPRSISALRRGVPVDLETICAKCLEKNPDSRYQSAQELSADLQRFLEGRPITARPVSHAEHFRRWLLRNPVVSSLLAGVILVAIVGTIAFNTQQTATQAALGKVAVKEAEKQKISLEAAETRARAIQGELEFLKTTAEPKRQEKSLLLIREAAQIRTEVLAHAELLDPHVRPFWEELEALLRTEALHWLSNSTLDRVQSLNLDARIYGDRQQKPAPTWIAVDSAGQRLAVPRNTQKIESHVPIYVIELFDLASGGHISEVALDGKTCAYPRPEAVAFSRDGKRLHVVVFSQSPSRERAVQSYSLPEGVLISAGTVTKEAQPLSQQFVFDTDGRRLLIFDWSKPMLWDLMEQKPIESPALGSLMGYASSREAILDFTGEGLLTTRGGQGLITRNLLTSAVVSELKLPPRYRSPIRSADGRWLVELKDPEGSQMRQGVDLGIVNAQTGEEYAKLVGIAGNIQTSMINNSFQFRDPPLLALSPDQPYAAVLTREELIVCELPQGNVLTRRKLELPEADLKKLIGLRFTGSNQLLTMTEIPSEPSQANSVGAQSPANRFQIQTWELSVSRLSPSKTLQIQHEPFDLAVSPAGDVIATVGPKNALRTFSAEGLPLPQAQRPFRGLFGMSPLGTALVEEVMQIQNGIPKAGTQIRHWNLATRQSKTLNPGRSVGYAFNRSEYSSGLPAKWPRTTARLALPERDGPGISILDSDSQEVQYTFTSPSWNDAWQSEMHPSDRFVMIRTNPPADVTPGDRQPASSRTEYALTVLRHPGGQPAVKIPRLLADPLFGGGHAMLIGVEPAGLTAYNLDSGQRLSQLKHASLASTPVGEFGYATSLSPTGRHAVLLTRKANAYQPLLWSVADGEATLLETTWSSQDVRQIRWNADGTRLVLTGRKPGASALTLEVWDTATRQKLATTAGRGAAPYQESPQFIADTNLLYLAVSSNNQSSTGEIWDLATGETVRKHAHGAFRVSSNGKYLAAALPTPEASADSRVNYQILDTISGNELLTTEDVPLSFSPDGKLLVCAEQKKAAKVPLVLWDIAAKERTPLLVDAQVSYSGTGPYAFDPTGRRFAVFDDQKVAIKIWDVASRQLEQTVPLLSYQPVSERPQVESKGLTFLPDGAHLLSFINGRVHYIDVTAKAVHFSLPRSNHSVQGTTGGSINSVAFNHDGGFLATAGSDATVNFWDGTTGEYAGMLEGFGVGVTSIRFHQAENQAITRDATGNLTLWGLNIDVEHPTDRVKPRVLWNRPTSGSKTPQQAATASRAAQLAVSRGTVPKLAVPLDSGAVEIRDWKTGEVTSSIAGTKQITGLAFHSEQPLLAVAYASKLVRLLNYETGAIVREWQVPEFPLNGLAFSRDGKHIVTVGHDVMFWNIATGQKDLQNEMPSTALTAVAVNPATGNLVMTAADQTLTLWNPYAIKEQLDALGLRWD